MHTAKSVILNTLRMFPVEFKEEDVEEIERRISVNYSASHPNSNLPGFAHVIARNWATDELRKRAVAAKRKARSLLQAERERQEMERLERCKKEFDGLVFKLLPNLVCSQSKQLDIVRLTCFEGLTDEENSRLFPGTNAMLRYQWKHRGIHLLLPLASPELKDFLLENRQKRGQTTKTNPCLKTGL